MTFFASLVSLAISGFLGWFSLVAIGWDNLSEHKKAFCKFGFLLLLVALIIASILMRMGVIPV